MLKILLNVIINGFFCSVSVCPNSSVFLFSTITTTPGTHLFHSVRLSLILRTTYTGHRWRVVTGRQQAAVVSIAHSKILIEPDVFTLTATRRAVLLFLASMKFSTRIRIKWYNSKPGYTSEAFGTTSACVRYRLYRLSVYAQVLTRRVK